MDAENDQNVDAALDEVMDEIIDEIFSESQENILRYGIYNTGFLLGKANVNRRFLEKEIVYTMPYAAVVEFGADPHRVSDDGIKAIARWVQKKLHKNEKESWRIANAIAWKIRHHGSKPRPFLRDAINTVSFKYGGN